VNISIVRNLKTKQYSAAGASIEAMTAPTQDLTSRELVRYLPYVLYNDDFTDRPVTSIDIPPVRPQTLTGWLSIYEKLFKVAKDGYSIFSLVAEKDERRRESILSDVEEYLDKTLTKEWKTFNLGKKEDIYVRLKLIAAPQTPAAPNKLNISIIEKIGEKERYFDVVDRSKGFLWFYNFVMKLQFNPKEAINPRTVYLLDEPGSYLHSTAQESLCSKIREISLKQGLVIYCTHSHHLLNPNQIPLTTIYIVEKDKNKNISVVSLPKVKTKTEKTHAMQPILEALSIPAFEFFRTDDPVVLVEGIYDKYAVELFAGVDRKLSVLPGVSADSIVKNCQIMLGFARVFIAIWDNDKEGKATYEKAAKLFGLKESERFDLLPLGTKKKRRMEDMIDRPDYEMMRNELGLPPDSNYESIMTTCFYSSKAIQSRVYSKLSQTSKDNFAILNSIIEKRIERASKLVER
jgi:hypothetical protein